MAVHTGRLMLDVRDARKQARKRQRGSSPHGDRLKGATA
jgi:hypothetical protein